MTLPIAEFDRWFEAGISAYETGRIDPENLPNLGDDDAQRAWLGGFAARWAELAESVVPQSPDGQRYSPPFEDVFVAVLADHPVIQAELWQRGAASIMKAAH